jgi:hypothetical protein
MRRNPVLKKVGIVAAAATAAMIALSPLAFATDSNGDHHDRDGETTNVWIDEESEERNQSNDCEFSQDFDNTATIDAGAW